MSLPEVLPQSEHLANTQEDLPAALASDPHVSDSTSVEFVTVEPLLSVKAHCADLSEDQAAADKGTRPSDSTVATAPERASDALTAESSASEVDEPQDEATGSYVVPKEEDHVTPCIEVTPNSEQAGGSGLGLVDNGKAINIADPQPEAKKDAEPAPLERHGGAVTSNQQPTQLDLSSAALLLTPSSLATSAPKTPSLAPTSSSADRQPEAKKETEPVPLERHGSAVKAAAVWNQQPAQLDSPSAALLLSPSPLDSTSATQTPSLAPISSFRPKAIWLKFGSRGRANRAAPPSVDGSSSSVAQQPKRQSTWLQRDARWRQCKVPGRSQGQQ